ncbi:glycosyltransferase [Colwellia sp. RE-S-Sl-9]
MKKLLISSFDMEVGGVERSLLSMLNNFDYEQFDVDLFLYSHTGDFLDLLPPQAKLLDEVKEYKTVRQSIKEIFKTKSWFIGVARTLAKSAMFFNKVKETNYLQTQLIWRFCLPFFPKMSKEYDVAISYLWPHDFIANKVNAKVKIAWIHTDYSAITTDVKADLKMWDMFDYIISISDDCSHAFVKKYPSLQKKLIVVENITSPDFVKTMSLENIAINTLDKNCFSLLSVGRLCHPKAFDKAIEVLALIHQKGFTHIKWYIIGYGPDQALLEKLIINHGLEDSFILLGKINNPYPYMKACDIYVQPSRYEGKAVTVSEAQILAKPILVANYPTAKSQIEHSVDGVISGNSREEIAQSIIDLYEDPNRRSALSHYCSMNNYNNSDELNKLYSIINLSV